MSYNNSHKNRQAILDYLHANPWVTTAAIRQGLDLDPKQLSNWLTMMFKAGELKKELIMVKHNASAKWFPLVKETYYSGPGSDTLAMAHEKIKIAHASKKSNGVRVVILSDKPCYRNQGGQGSAGQRFCSSLEWL